MRPRVGLGVPCWYRRTVGGIEGQVSTSSASNRFSKESSGAEDGLPAMEELYVGTLSRWKAESWSLLVSKEVREKVSGPRLRFSLAASCGGAHGHMFSLLHSQIISTDLGTQIVPHVEVLSDELRNGRIAIFSALLNIHALIEDVCMCGKSPNQESVRSYVSTQSLRSSALQ
nr:hypothetical protein CFP56_37281 [Quercus suber]